MNYWLLSVPFGFFSLCTTWSNQKSGWFRLQSSQLQSREISLAALQTQTRCVTLPTACIQTLAHSTAFLELNARAAATLVCSDVRMRRRRGTSMLARVSSGRAAPRNPIKENSANYKPSYSPLLPSTPSSILFVLRNSNDSSYYRQRLSALFPRAFRLSRAREDDGGGSRGDALARPRSVRRTEITRTALDVYDRFEP